MTNPSDPTDGGTDLLAGDQPAQFVALVDTDLFFVVKVRDTLQHAGYTTRTARTAADLARMLREDHPVVALVNTAARGVDYVEIIKLARAARTPVIAYGAHVDLATQQQARDAGATRVITNAKLAADLPGIVARVLASNAPS